MKNEQKAGTFRRADRARCEEQGKFGPGPSGNSGRHAADPCCVLLLLSFVWKETKRGYANGSGARAKGEEGRWWAWSKSVHCPQI